MTRSVHPSHTDSEHRQPKDTPIIHREHLQPIHKMSHEQQITLVEEARAARQAERARRRSRNVNLALPTNPS
jgi:hypothetical protein